MVGPQLRTYTPNSNFVGVDGFTYRVSDGTGNSAAATVNIAVGRTFSAKLNASELGPTNNVLHSGAFPIRLAFSSTDALIHRADSINPQVLVPLETIYNGATSGTTVTSIVAVLTFNGSNQASVTYNQGLGTLTALTIRFKM